MRILFKSLLILTLIIGASQLIAKETIKGSTLGNYAKPGADVGMEYSSQKVDVLENASIVIDLIPNTHYNEMKVRITMDEALQNLSDTPESMRIKIVKGQKKYPIEMEVNSETVGIHYIKMIISAGDRSIAFTIPVYVGDTDSLKKSKTSKQLKIMKAKEEID